MTPEAADAIAVECLAWLAGNEELMPVFLGASGLAAEDLRQAVTDPAFLGGVLDFILMDDAWVVACCDSLRLPYDRLMQARAALPGGQQTHWT